MSSSLPSGTVTFLFTDIEGSTPFWECEPDAMRLALDQHHAILHQVIETHAGRVFKTVGDAFLSAFSLPSQAVEAAIAAQRQLAAQTWPTSSPVRVRMGIHIGPAVTEGSDYATTHTLNRVARIMAAARGGQILISLEVFDLMRGYLLAGVTLLDMGQHRLKGLSQLEHLFQIVIPELPSDFPPLESAVLSPNNLPIQLSSFIGREKEIADVKHLLADVPLVTLTGPGGTGKTRLSLQIAADLLGDFPDGVWLVELAPLSDPQLVPQAVAAVWSVREQPGRSMMDALTDYLRHKSLLLVLDNCEHLIDACAWLATNLLRQCPNMKILPSSREALGVAGEMTYRLPSLSLPDKNQPLSPESFSQYEAVRLFVDRAQAAKPSFTATEHNLSSIAQICWRLDGIPLALELAAARLKLLTVEQIAERIDDRFRLLTGGSRTALPRQQTLRAMIDWSYDLLSDPEKAALRKLSVFAGGCKFEAAEALVGSEALDLLSQLVNRSMVVVDEEAAEVRYRLLETIRQYAGEKLFEAQEAEQARSLHLTYYLNWVEDSESRLFGPEMIAYFDELEVEQENLRAALAWALTTAPMSALRMVAVLYYFWSRRVSPTEGLHWVKTALERSEAAFQMENEESSSYLLVKAKSLTGQAYISFMMGDNITARSLVETSISLARQINSTRTLAMALSVGALIGGMLGDVDATLAWANEGIVLCREQGYVFELGLLSGAFLFLARNSNEPYQSALQVDHLQAARLSGNPMVIALALFHQAQWAVMKGNWAEAYAGFEETAVLFHQMRDRPFYNSSRSEIGHILRHQGRYQEAAAVYRETILLWQEQGQYAAVAHEIECLAFIAASIGQNERSARLLGVAEAMRESISAAMMREEEREYDQAVSALRLQLGDTAFASAWAEGRALPLERAIVYALQTDEANALQ